MGSVLAVVKVNQIPGFPSCRTASRSRGRIIPLHLAGTCETMSGYYVQFWAPRYKKDFDKVYQRLASLAEGRAGWRGRSTQHTKWASGTEGAGVFSLKKRRLGKDFIAVLKCLMGDYREDGGSLFSEVHSEKIRANRQ